MPVPGRTFAGDEELGKKFDDHRPNGGGASLSSSLPWRAPIRLRKRRVFTAILVSLLLYIFFKYIPTDLGPRSTTLTPTNSRSPAGFPTPPTGKPPHDDDQEAEAGKHYFSGPIRFYKLAPSLHAVLSTMGHRPSNRNVVFAASSLRSASVMIPMACEMARWRRNMVHFVIMGREELSINGIKEVNGVTADCDVQWHGTETLRRKRATRLTKS